MGSCYSLPGMPHDLTNVLPPLYARWMAELLQGPLPDEGEATCDDCSVSRRPGVKVHVVQRGQPPEFEERTFERHLKCCTVMPRLANFLVGAALADGTLSEVGRTSLRARIATRKAVTPFGLWQVEAGHLDYRRRVRAEFGLNRELLCPHYAVEADNCGIWRHRNGVCSSYFCRPVRGLDGATFWLGGFRPLSRAVEPALAQWAAREVGLPEPCLLVLYDFRRHPEAAPWSDLCDDGGEPDPASCAAGWGPWLGREEAFYVACAEKVAALSWAEVVRICGAPVAALAEVTSAAHRALQIKQLPRRMKVNWGNFYFVDGAAFGGKPDRYLSYDWYDHVELPRSLSVALMLFKGDQDTALVLRKAEEQGAVFTPAILQDLLSHRILVDAAPEGG